MQTNETIQELPQVLVIGSGGIKGLMTLGFLSILEDNNYLEQVEIFCGVSVGAIISFMYVIGMKTREITSELLLMDVFQNGSIDIDSIWSKKGLISNEPIRRKLSQLVKDRFGIIPTLYELYLLTGKTLITTTLNATDEKCMMFDYHTQASVSCVDAVMFSMNIPFIFYQLVHQGKTYVDGALANAYPVDYVDDNQHRILGIYMRTICRTAPVIKKIIEPMDSQNISLVEYAHKMIQFILDQQRNSIVKNSSNKCMHICLECNVIDGTGITISNEEKAQLIVTGFNEGRRFIGEGYKAPTIQNLKFPYSNDEDINIIAEINNNENLISLD